jgi:tetratricopeptide (TPR) repeat protein
MGGWIEEVWVSRIEAAKLRERMARPEADVVVAYLAAYEARPERAESLCELARYYRLQKKYALAYLFAEQAGRIPLPDDILFVDTSVYAWRARDEHAVAAYYLGKHVEAIVLNTELLSDGKLPSTEVERVKRNRGLSERALASPVR